MTSDTLSSIWQAARLIEQADALIIAAGAGMGVDSGLPDFRGPEGFWNAYPALAKAGIGFEQIASPWYFESEPMLAWGFYGHRLQLYRETTPHAGFAQLKRISDHLPEGGFVFTSNVDGHFQKAGFFQEGVVEVHGSIHHLQCLHGCMHEIWSAARFRPQVDHDTCQLINPPPRCPHCGAIARPNILMFGDSSWIEDRSMQQQWDFHAWRANVKRPVVIELGAGTRIPSVRAFGERQRCPIIRINKREWHSLREQDISIPLGAAEAIHEISSCLDESGFLGLM